MSIDDDAAIRRLIDAYADAVFRRDAEDWGQCWAVDSRWLLMGTEVAGRDAIVGLWTQAMAGFVFVAFFSQVGRIDIDGDRATGRIWTHEVLEHPDGTVTRPVGRYDDVYVRTGEGWRFAERRYTMLKG
jgi:uncharacterized protein (TIGR02246 family)